MQIKDNYFNQTLIQYLVLIGVLFPLFSFSQLSKQHYIPPVPDIIFESAHLYISTPHENVQFTINPIGQPSSSWVVGTLSNTNSYKIKVANNQVGAKPWNYSPDYVFANKGFEVLAKWVRLKTMVGAWLGDDDKKNKQEIKALIELANEGNVDIAVLITSISSQSHKRCRPLSF